MGRYILYGQKPGGTPRDITKLVQSLSWTGNDGQIARQVSCTLAVPSDGTQIPPPDLGDQITLWVDGTQCFTGTVVKRQRGSMASTLEVTALDGGWRLAQNKGFYKFKNVSARDATLTVCRDFGIPVGQLASGGGKYSRKFPGASLDKIIYTMYTFAGEDSGCRYFSRFSGKGLFEVVEKPKQATLTIAPRVNSMGIDITEDISKMSTLVSIYSDDGKPIRKVTGEAYEDFKIPLQHVLIQRKGEDAVKEAKAFLEDNGLCQCITVDCLGDARLLSGNAILLRENRSGAVGLCWIESDTHTFKNKQYFCQLKVNFKNLMHKETGGSELK